MGAGRNGGLMSNSGRRVFVGLLFERNNCEEINQASSILSIVKQLVKLSYGTCVTPNLYNTNPKNPIQVPSTPGLLRPPPKPLQRSIHELVVNSRRRTEN